MEDEGWLGGEAAAQPVDLAEFERLCSQMFEQRAVVEQHERKLADESKKLEAMKLQVLKVLESQGLEKFQSKLGLVYTVDRLTYTMPKEPTRKSAFFKYLVRKGVFEELVTVHSQTLNAFCKAEFEAQAKDGATDVEIPGLDAPKHVRTLSLRKG